MRQRYGKLLTGLQNCWKLFTELQNFQNLQAFGTRRQEGTKARRIVSDSIVSDNAIGKGGGLTGGGLTASLQVKPSIGDECDEASLRCGQIASLQERLSVKNIDILNKCKIC
jgi:hypothetical protein